MMVAKSLAKKVHIQQACAVLNLPRSSYYRWQDRTKECRYVIIDIFIRYALGWMIVTRKLTVSNRAARNRELDIINLSNGKAIT